MTRRWLLILRFPDGGYSVELFQHRHWAEEAAEQAKGRATVAIVANMDQLLDELTGVVTSQPKTDNAAAFERVIRSDPTLTELFTA
jgi:hypothetical protein